MIVTDSPVRPRRPSAGRQALAFAVLGILLGSLAAVVGLALLQVAR